MYQSPELIIDKELEDLLFTDKDCSPLQVPFIYKKMRRDSRGNTISCKACNKNKDLFKEGSLDCPYCEGLGYEWDEGTALGWFYKNSMLSDRNLMSSAPSEVGLSIFNKQYLVTDKDVLLKQNDHILRLVLDDDNTPKLPLQLDGMYQVVESENNRSNTLFSQFNTYTLDTENKSLFRGILDA